MHDVLEVTQKAAVLVDGLATTARHEFRAAILEKYHELGRFEIGKAVALRRILRNERLFEAAYQHATRRAAAEYVHANANGDFLKWFLEWFSSGGWEEIIEFIKALLPIFGIII